LGTLLSFESGNWIWLLKTGSLGMMDRGPFYNPGGGRGAREGLIVDFLAGERELGKLIRQEDVRRDQ
jgi:hypothetical protein